LLASYYSYAIAASAPAAHVLFIRGHAICRLSDDGEGGDEERAPDVTMLSDGEIDRSASDHAIYRLPPVILFHHAQPPHARHAYHYATTFSAAFILLFYGSMMGRA